MITFPTTTQSDREFNAELAKIDRWLTDPSADRMVRRRREIQYCFGPGTKTNITPERRAITSFSAASANRLRRYIDNYYTDFSTMVTLTYGRDFPTDGRIVKRHLRAFFERLRRYPVSDSPTDLGRWMERHSLVWWIEYQERGAPHIHFVATGWIGKTWLSECWAEITNGDVSACSRVEALLHADSAGSYAAKYAAKAEQHQVPEGFTNCGRHWGRVGRRPADGSTCTPKLAAAIPARVGGALRAAARAHLHAREFNRDAKARPGAQFLVELPPIYVGEHVLWSTRCYQHDGGYSIYGPEREIELLWEYLNESKNHGTPYQRAKCASTDRPGRDPGDSRQQTSLEFTAWR